MLRMKSDPLCPLSVNKNWTQIVSTSWEDVLPLWIDEEITLFSSSQAT